MEVWMESVNFIFHFWGDESTKWATDDGKNIFYFPLIPTITGLKPDKKFSIEISKKGKGV